MLHRLAAFCFTRVARSRDRDGKRLVVHADELLTAFVELESAIRVAECREDGGARGIRLDKLSRMK